jgi:hypothetical protein
MNGVRISVLPFPLHPPARALATIAMGKLVDTPHSKLANMVQVKPIRMAGLRPNLSEALPHITAVRHCEREKTPEVIPAHFAMFFFSMPKLSIISGCFHVSGGSLKKWVE